MKHATSLALYAYWQRSHGRGGVPAAEIRAAELAPILPTLFLVDLDLAAGLRFRYCGASIAMRYGRDLTHESFLALWSGADRELLERDVRVMALRATGMVAGVLAETVGGGFTSFEMLLLPLSGGEAGTAGAIGSMVRVDGHEEMNRIRARFVSQSLRSVRILPALEGGLRRSADIVSPLFRPAKTDAGRQYRHLTVLPGGR